ncbi:MAG: UDP-N-acetylmuramate--L-alanine ligase [Candidatus Omnitrophica bacterium]|nr:UDP-N-acetylmuramate--L-alanine ligase [Candidatus Omnitrophota bacterium]
MSKHYHFIGIGGIGMSGIAQLLLRCGMKVSGSDLKAGKITEELKSLGAEIFIGHNPENIRDANTVIYSSAIKEDNPEVVEAKNLNIPLKKRAEALAELMRDKTVITVTGSHGKTTTTSLASYLLMEAGLLPTVAIGGILNNIDTNACLGNGSYFVAEADESDGSFLYYQPQYSIITNIDREHLDYYGEFNAELDAFKAFITKTKDNGCVFCCADDKNLKKLIADCKNRYLLFGLKEEADIYPKNIELKDLASKFDCYFRNKFVATFDLALAGEHNISNSLAVIAWGLELGIDLGIIKKTLLGYKGARRRLEVKFRDKNYLVIDDYAHHPTEIKATLSAIHGLKRNRIIAVFQPHRYTRTKLLMEEFSACFDLADYLVVTDIYPAGEPPLEGVNGKGLFDKIKQRSPDKEMSFLQKEEIVAHILRIMKPGDLIITLSAGDIVKVSDELAKELKNRNL